MNKQLNNPQKKALKAWKGSLWGFAKREWLSVLVWSAMGAFGAALARLFIADQLFKAFAITTFLPSAKHFEDTRLYFPYALAILLAVSAVVIIYGLDLVARGLKSWITGVTSGLCLLPFVSMFVVLTVHCGTVQRQLLVDLAVVAGCFLLGFALHLAGRVHVERTLHEEDLRVPLESRSLAGTELSESDDPIQTWREDALGRASLVDSISIKLMIAKSPVLALFGKFGSGKTSILNLLREHLREQAIVVSFSTWLPGSQETLTSYLLGDIASECQKQYVVPGLSKSTRRMASALAQTVPFLKGYSELFPAGTQKDDIQAMSSALSRLPKRVVVLLDELDRMEKDELLTLLKVIRGISTLRNVSFVCAADRETIVKTVRGSVTGESTLYFEKFFPVSVKVPEPDSDALQKAGTERLVAAFRRRSWFDDESDEDRFRKQIDGLWSERIAPFCRNLRAIGLLSNDVSAAAAMLWREVHPVDLTLIELLRRFIPSIYEIVGRNSIALTGGETWLRGGGYQSDKEREGLKERLLGDIKKATEGDEQLDQVKGILSELFPKFKEIAGRSWFSGSERQAPEDDEKRIFHPGIFPAYFRYELPRALFSSVELELFVQKIDRASSDDDRHRAFLEKLVSMEKGSPRRDDFLGKLSDRVTSMRPEVGRALVDAAMRAADKYVYDSAFPWFGEAGHALRMVKNLAEKTPRANRAALLSRCIDEAADDTMAFRICTRLTAQQADLNLGVSLEEIYPGFAKKMRSRYGPGADAQNVDLSTSDANAFNLWGLRDPEDRKLEHAFWVRYIGESKSRLAQAFQGIFMPVGIYEKDPTPFVENKISTLDLRRLYETLPNDEAMTESDRKSLHRLKRFLNGEFANGIGFDQLDDRVGGDDLR
jgi:hypothetical protein